MRARVPASSANLGPGFDTLGLALQRYIEVEIQPAVSRSVEVIGEGADIDVTDNHLALRIVRDLLGHDRVSIRITSDIPLSRGLGSSASFVVAVAAAAGHENPLRYAALLEGHADNAAASVLGGFVTAAIVDGRVVATRLPLDPSLQFVAVIPDRHLATKRARGVLPARVPRGDAVHNLGAMGQMIAGMADRRVFDALADDDRLHQPYRTRLFPESTAILTSLREAGADVAFWSGAGPTLLAVCARERSAAIASAGEQALRSTGIEGAVCVLDADTTGVVLTP